MTGNEWIEYDWQNEFEGIYQTTLAAAWFGEGPDEFGYPGIHFRLDASSKGENIPLPKVGEMIAVEGKRTMGAEDFTALWDGIAASLRPRPGAF